MSDDPWFTEDLQTFLEKYHFSNREESSNVSNKFPYDGFISIWQPKTDLENHEQNEAPKVFQFPDGRRNKLEGEDFSSVIKVYATQNLIESPGNFFKTVCLGKVHAQNHIHISEL